MRKERRTLVRRKSSASDIFKYGSCQEILRLRRENFLNKVSSGVNDSNTIIEIYHSAISPLDKHSSPLYFWIFSYNFWNPMDLKTYENMILQKKLTLSSNRRPNLCERRRAAAGELYIQQESWPFSSSFLHCFYS